MATPHRLRQHTSARLFASGLRFRGKQQSRARYRIARNGAVSGGGTEAPAVDELRARRQGGRGQLQRPEKRASVRRRFWLLLLVQDESTVEDRDDCRSLGKRESSAAK
jgi:hypothetical protein